MKKIPIFKSHYSIGRSILTLEAAGSSKETEPDSIFDLCVKYSIKDLYLVEDGLSGYLEALKNSSELKINLRFGVRFLVCADINKKDEESKSTEHRVIIMAKNDKGVEQLIKLYEKASKVGFYYKPRLDFETIHSLWTEDLIMCLPFYDSFIHENFLKGNHCVPMFKNIKPFLFEEDNDFIFDNLISKRLHEYAAQNKLEVIKTQTVYYHTRKDFLSYMTFRCINERSTLEKPQLEFFSSKNFCLENAL